MANATSYIGDGCYVRQDEFGAVWLETSDGATITNQVCLEPEVLREFLRFLRNVGVKDSEVVV